MNFGCVCMCVCARTRAHEGTEGQEGQENGCGTEERGVSTHTNEGDKLLIGVFIRAVGRQREALQLVGHLHGEPGIQAFHILLWSQGSPDTTGHFPSHLRMARGTSDGGKPPSFACCTTRECQHLGWASLYRGGIHLGGEAQVREGSAWMGGSQNPVSFALGCLRREMGGETENTEKRRKLKIYLAHPPCFQEIP